MPGIILHVLVSCLLTLSHFNLYLLLWLLMPSLPSLHHDFHECFHSGDIAAVLANVVNSRT